jgi:hypothetical protein
LNAVFAASYRGSGHVPAAGVHESNVASVAPRYRRAAPYAPAVTAAPVPTNVRRVMEGIARWSSRHG